MKAAFKYFIIWLLLTIAISVFVYIIGSIVLSSTGNPVKDMEVIIDNAWIMSISLLAADIVLLLVFWKRRYTRFGFNYGYTYGEGFSTKKLFMWCGVGAIGCLIFNLMAEFYLPIPEDLDIFNSLMQMMTNPIGLISVCLIGPWAEEVLFRGAIERRLLEKKWNPWFAIVISALFFAVAHFNYSQGFTAIIIGIFMGWIYYRMRSIWPTVFIHALNNTTATVVALMSPEAMNAEEYTPPMAIGLPLLVVGIILIAVTVIYIDKLTRDRTPIPVPVDEVLPPPLPAEALARTESVVVDAPIPVDETFLANDSIEQSLPAEEQDIDLPTEP